MAEGCVLSKIAHSAAGAKFVPSHTLDAAAGPINLDFMGPLQRAINLFVALTLVALGWGGLAYFYFIDVSWPWGVKVACGIVGAAGLHWLWEEHVNAGERWD